MRDDTASPMEETPLETMSRPFFRIRIIQEGIYIKCILTASHIRQRRLNIGLLRRTPDKETGIIVIQIIHVHAIVQPLYPGIVIRKIPTDPDTAVVIILPIPVVQECISPHCQIKILDPTGMREIQASI